MDLTLLLDSSHQEMIIGIAQNKTLLASLRIDAWQRQSEWMMPKIVALLTQTSATLKDVKQIFVGAGPGSYTGTRIALTIAKVLALMNHVEVSLISSLHMLADGEKPTLVVMDARADRSYVGVYKGTKVIVSDTVWTNQQVLHYIQQHQDMIVRGYHPKLALPLTIQDPFAMFLMLGLSQKPILQLSDIKPYYVKEQS
jgi:tRNA threonylcarbamoyl adenosine modification protein YeaZ